MLALNRLLHIRRERRERGGCLGAAENEISERVEDSLVRIGERALHCFDKPVAVPVVRRRSHLHGGPVVVKTVLELWPHVLRQVEKADLLTAKFCALNEERGCAAAREGIGGAARQRT